MVVLWSLDFFFLSSNFVENMIDKHTLQDMYIKDYNK